MEPTPDPSEQTSPVVGDMLAFCHAQPVGSLLRPEYLKSARREAGAGSLPAYEFKAVEDRAVREAVELQVRAGLDVITDGEQRRLAFHKNVVDALAGFEWLDQAVASEWYSAATGEVIELSDGVVVVDQLRRRRSAFSEEFAFTRGCTDRLVKMAIPSPTASIHAWSPGLSSDAYPSPGDFIADVAAFLREDIVELVELGCRYVQIDAPELTMAVDERRRLELRELVGIGADEMVDHCIGAINEMVAGLPVRVGLHLCRGNWDGRYMAEGGYEALATSVFARATNVDDFFLEFDDERSGAFDVLGAVPDDKCVVLGLISTKHAELESAAGLVNRLEEAFRWFPREQLGLSTQCGFASGFGGNHITAHDQEAKLGRVTQLAREVWGG